MNDHKIVNLGAIPKDVPQDDLPMIGAQAFVSFVRKLDDNGAFRAESAKRAPNGQTLAIAGRDAYMDASQLIEAIGDTVRAIVRAELQAFKEGQS